MMKITETLTPESYPEPMYSSRCTFEGCPETRQTSDSAAYLKGWWERHVRESGHTVVIEEPVTEAAEVDPHA